MSIECAFFGFLSADAEVRTSQAGKQWARIRVGVGKDDIQWVSVAVFGKAAETAGELKKGDRVYCEGMIKIDSWRGNDGAERVSPTKFQSLRLKHLFQSPRLNHMFLSPR